MLTGAEAEVVLAHGLPNPASREPILAELLDHFSHLRGQTVRGAYLSLSTNPAARASLFAVDRHGSMVRRGGEPRSKYISCLSSHGILFLSPTTFLLATSQER